MYDRLVLEKALFVFKRSIHRFVFQKLQFMGWAGFIGPFHLELRNINVHFTLTLTPSPTPSPSKSRSFKIILCN
jgi:hypothetical protein